MTLTQAERQELLSQIGEKKYEYETAKSQLGPIILAILGVLSAIFLIGFVLIIAAAIWGVMRDRNAKRLINEIAELEAKLAQG